MHKRGTLFGIAASAVLLLAAVLLFYSCGGGSGGGSNSSGTIALYATDDISNYQQVIATINKVQVVNTGTGATCDVLTTPVTINIANLADVLQVLNVADCPAVPYNRVHIEFNKTVELMDAADTTATCSFVSYKDKSNRPNVLHCSGTTCSLDVTGAVNVLVGQHHKLALDFDLKEFDVDQFGSSACTVTLKVSPIHGAAFGHLGHAEGLTGLVSNVSTSAHTFSLTKGHWTFSIEYSGITSSQQPGIDELLLRAQQDRLRTRVLTENVDCSSQTIIASTIVVKAEGKVSDLDTVNHTFTLTYKLGKTMKVDYSKAVIEGTLANDAWVEVKLYGYDSISSNVLAARVGVEYESSVPDHFKSEVKTED